MKQSELFSKTSKTSESGAQSVNHDLLTRAGFVDQLMAGVYSFLPLGWRVIQNISQIVREEMNDAGAQEINLPALHPKANWEQTGRWDSMDVLFKTKSQAGSEYALGPTHEEVIVPLARKFIQSYRDLPGAWYQMQVKFRDELRAKAGLLRGREFLMKDLYSFHASHEDLMDYYEKMKSAYLKVFSRCGLEAIITQASGGSFTKEYSHEFQVETLSGEDAIFYCACGFAQNREISKVKQGDECPQCGKKIQELKTIEVGNIFDLGTKFSNDFKVVYTDEAGKQDMVHIGCYGIGISRLMGAIVEVRHDKDGIIWPDEVAPFKYHLLSLNDKGEEVYKKLVKYGVSVLWDDRDASAGEKMADSDLIGIPNRLVISNKTGDKIELKKRSEKDVQLVSLKDMLS